MLCISSSSSLHILSLFSFILSLYSVYLSSSSVSILFHPLPSFLFLSLCILSVFSFILSLYSVYLSSSSLSICSLYSLVPFPILPPPPPPPLSLFSFTLSLYSVCPSSALGLHSLHPVSVQCLSVSISATCTHPYWSHDREETWTPRPLQGGNSHP